MVVKWPMTARGHPGDSGVALDSKGWFERLTATEVEAYPVGLFGRSMPEPDFALVPKSKAVGDYPRKAPPLIEVANSSVRGERLVKAPLYAEGGSPEYWIVNTKLLQLEVFRKPVGGQWPEQFVLGPKDSIRPVSFPDVALSSGDILVAPSH